MKLHHAFLFFLVLLWGLGIALALTPSNGPPAGKAHPQLAPMQQSSVTYDDQAWLLGWLFGLAILGSFVSLLVFGSGGRDPGGFRNALIVGGLLYAGTFTWLMHAYRDFIAGIVPFMGPFPLATALVLFGMWPVPCYFALVYLLGFERWILTPEDEARFHTLVAVRKSATEEE